nr:MAG TPA: hypothetical protein [Caudoviricetes sp.]
MGIREWIIWIVIQILGNGLYMGGYPNNRKNNE